MSTLKYAVVLSHQTGSSWDGTLLYHYTAVECNGLYRYVEPMYSTLQEAEAQAKAFSGLGYRV